MPPVNDDPPSTLEGRLVRLELIAKQNADGITHLVDCVHEIAHTQNARPSWAVSTMLTLLSSTVFALVTALVIVASR